jgi:hypothetical protein
MLLQASKLYTPTIFEAFQGEYERSMVACTTSLEGNNEYLVTIGSLAENFTYFDKEYKVTGNPLSKPVHAVLGSSLDLERCVAML